MDTWIHGYMDTWICENGFFFAIRLTRHIILLEAVTLITYFVLKHFPFCYARPRSILPRAQSANNLSCVTRWTIGDFDVLGEIHLFPLARIARAVSRAQPMISCPQCGVVISVERLAPDCGASGMGGSEVISMSDLQVGQKIGQGAYSDVFEANWKNRKVLNIRSRERDRS